MTNAFSHFDSSHRETFLAALLLFAMEVDASVKKVVADMVLDRIDNLKNRDSWSLARFGREARLAETEDDSPARCDLWLHFLSSPDSFYALVEVKTHNRWGTEYVAKQVRDQSQCIMAGSRRSVEACVLLAPDRLCRRVGGFDPKVRAITWPQLLRALRNLSEISTVAKLAIDHLEENMERPAGLDRALTAEDFEQATTTIGCLRQFILDCVYELGGSVRGPCPTWFSSGDGNPIRRGGWAWHGLSVPCTFNDGRKGRVGIYRYVDGPPDEQDGKPTLWLEAYVGEDVDSPKAFVEFAPDRLTANELYRMRNELSEAWKKAQKA